MAHGEMIIEPVAIPSGRRRRAPKYWRNRNRRIIRSALRAISNIEKLDNREGARAEAQGYYPILVQGNGGSPDFRAFARVKKALADNMALEA